MDYIVDSRFKGRKIEFLVHWKGWSVDDRTWQSEKDLANAKEAIRDFYASKPSAPRRLRMSFVDFASLGFVPYENITDSKSLAFNHLEVDV